MKGTLIKTEEVIAADCLTRAFKKMMLEPPRAYEPFIWYVKDGSINVSPLPKFDGLEMLITTGGLDNASAETREDVIFKRVSEAVKEEIFGIRPAD